MDINYLSFMEEYQEELDNEMNEYFEAKEGVYKDNFYFRDHLQVPYISKELSKSKTRDAIVELVNKFLDEHVDQLSTSGPVYTFTFADKETKILYELFNITPEKIIEIYNNVVAETYFGDIDQSFTGWVKQAPHKILLNAILIESLQHGYDDMIECVKWMYAFTEYPILYRKYWSLGVKKELMDYTIEHLSSKYKITNMKNIQDLLFYHSNKVITSKDDVIKVGMDNVYLDLIRLIRNQFNNNLKNISRAYYANDKLGVTLHTKDSQFDDGTLTDQEGHSTNTARAVDNTINKFAVSEINSSLVKLVADATDTDKETVTTFLNQIMKEKSNKLYRFVEDIITSYFNRNPTNTSLGSSEFLNFGLALYRSIGTSKDSMYIEIKTILLYWMNEIISIRKIYSSEGTCSLYTRAIFNYFIFAIHSYN